MGGAFLRQVISKSPKIVFFSTHNIGPVMFERLRASFPDVFSQLKYGDDYVNLGFLPLAEATFASIASGAKELVGKDPYGASTADMPIFNVADKAADFTTTVLLTTSTDPIEYSIRQWHTTFKMPILFMVVAVIGPSVQPFVASGQAVGMLSGQNTAAQYELLIKKPGSALAALDAQSGAHVLIMIYIVLGNLIYLAMRKSEKVGVEAK
jgi:lipoprotein signal peptidase